MSVLRLTKIISLIAVLFFSASILTVEYHQVSNKGSLRSRCPTCIEGNMELAISNLSLIGLRFYLTPELFFPFDNTVYRGLLTVFSNICRSPPSTVLL